MKWEMGIAVLGRKHFMRQKKISSAVVDVFHSSQSLKTKQSYMVTHRRQKSSWRKQIESLWLLLDSLIKAREKKYLKIWSSVHPCVDRWGVDRGGDKFERGWGTRIAVLFQITNYLGSKDKHVKAKRGYDTSQPAFNIHMYPPRQIRNLALPVTVSIYT